MHRVKKYIIQEGQVIPSHIEALFEECFEYNDIQTYGRENYCQFTGFIIQRDKMLVSFPKHYFAKPQIEKGDFLGTTYELNDHLNLLFSTIRKATLKKSERAIGINQDVNSHYPFEAFFYVYNYYKLYGLYTNELERHKLSYSGKISWKKTLEKSPMVISENNLLYLPMVVKKRYNEHVFLTKCMAYVIDNTIDRFSIFLKLERTEFEYRDINFNNKQLILNRLREISQTIFKDIDKGLIRYLISYFENDGYSSDQIQIKLHSFNLIWEDMVETYLNKYFLYVESEGQNQRLVFSTEVNDMKYNFKKEFFYPDIRGLKGHRLEPDHYSNYKGNIYLFDSKYYNEVKGLDYKQVAYYFLLANRKVHSDSNKIYNALILPTKKDSSLSSNKKHFMYDQNFTVDSQVGYKPKSDQDIGFIIHECYLDIQKVMRNY